MLDMLPKEGSSDALAEMEIFPELIFLGSSDAETFDVAGKWALEVPRGSERTKSMCKSVPPPPIAAINRVTFTSP